MLWIFRFWQTRAFELPQPRSCQRMHKIKPWILALCAGLAALFSFLGKLYFEHYVAQRPHGVILFLVPGLEMSLLERARRVAQLRGRDLWICRDFRVLASLSLVAPHNTCLEEGVVASSLACGQRVSPGKIALGPNGQRLDSLFYSAQRKGRATGFVTDGDLTNPWLAAFYSQSWTGPDPLGQTAAELLDSARPNLALGGGGQHFSPATLRNEYGRRDGRNLLEEARAWGYQVVHRSSELEELAAWRSRWVLGLFAPGPLYFVACREEVPHIPSLAMMTRRAIEMLQYNLRGYLLIVEEDLLAQACRKNWTELALRQVEELDAAVEIASRYAGTRCLLVLVGVRGFGFVDTPPPNVPAPRAEAGEWFSGPGGIPKELSQARWLKEQKEKGIFSESSTDWFYPHPACSFAFEALPTANPGWLAARGPGSEKLGGFYDSTELFRKLDPCL
ncbi:putative Alkaline phosphatase [Candidatus Methylacidithermus pantelleriae]|uniref:Putative Alkaline phosphatase n=2 Tax=Candidatus Methylacidithermus pantelleriae TaxID=2744239 RepID=A0A8J2FP03_9BACT|nr:putative Alkaline phosphatase [Candidatus Methylacidithermus pantelleriae]